MNVTATRENKDQIRFILLCELQLTPFVNFKDGDVFEFGECGLIVDENGVRCQHRDRQDGWCSGDPGCDRAKGQRQEKKRPYPMLDVFHPWPPGRS